MSGLTFEKYRPKRLRVNDRDYEILATDAELVAMMAGYAAAGASMERARAAAEALAGAPAGGAEGEAAAAAVLAGAGEYAAHCAGMAADIDRILGAGALKKIMGTDRLPGAALAGAFRQIAEAALAQYDDAMNERYG